MKHRRTELWLLATTLVVATGLSACSRQPAGGDSGEARAQISGVIVLAPGQSMPAGMPLEIDLVEWSSAQQPPAPIASIELASAEGTETPFTLPFAADKVRTGRPYLLQARAVIQKTTYLTGTAVAPIPAGGAAFPVDVVLRRPEHASPLYLDVSVLRLEYKGESDWSAKLRDVMPAMLACLHSVSGAGLRVTKAWSMGGGRVGVRIRADDGNGFECIALADGSKFETLSGMPSFVEPLPGEGNPSFVPAPSSPKMEPCRRYERVLGGANETIGWLVYDTCLKDAPQAGVAPAGNTPSP
jgi:uncharacterized lipoprotein YbaY